MKTIIRGILAVVLAFATACGDDDSSNGSSLDTRIDHLFGGQSFGTLDRSTAATILTTAPEDDAPFYMVNLIRYREQARYPDGRPSDLTGREADDLYGALIAPILSDMSATIVYAADIELNLQSIAGDAWDLIGIVRYPSFAALVAMLERQDFRDAAIHKEAGVEASLVLVGRSAIDFPPEFLELDLTSVPYPPTEDDPPIAIVHLLAFNEFAQYADGRETDLTGREAMELYEQGRISQGVAGLGARPGLVLNIEAELIGDGRAWDELRVNNFPSRATFAEVTSSESLNEAGIEHRMAAIFDTYALVTAPIITEVGYR